MLWFSIAVAVLVSFVCGFVACYIVSLLTSATEEEDNHGWLCRVLAVCFIVLACCNVLILPLDVAISAEVDTHESGTWQSSLILRLSQLSVLLSVSLFVIGVPLAVAIYECDEPGLIVSSVGCAKSCVVTVVFSIAVSCSAFFALWWQFGFEVASSAVNEDMSSSTSTSAHDAHSMAVSASHTEVMAVRVPPLLYLAALMSCAGWFCFVWAGALGLAATPIAGVWHFLHRPRPLSVDQYEALRKQLHDESAKLLAEGRGLDATMSATRTNPTYKQWQKLQMFRRHVRTLQRRVDEMHAAAEFWSSRSVIQAYILFILSLCCGLVSVAWIVHILLCNIMSLSSFLDTLIVALNRVFRMFAVVVYGILSLYLLWCSAMGVSLLARLPFAPIPAFAMRVEATTPNALLLNSALLLLSSFAVQQLCTVSFPAYAANTTLLDLYSHQLASVQGARHVAPWLQYMLVTLTLLSALFTFMKPAVLDSVTVLEDDDDDSMV